MAAAQTIDILKRAILLERRGHAFYSRLARQAAGQAVRKFFEMMAEEEEKHVRILSDQFRALQAGKPFSADHANDEQAFGQVAAVLTDELKKQIAAADYEAAAIAAAMGMEKNAIQLYSRRAAEAENAAEKQLYQWLAQWEQQHLEFLSRIDRELTEQIWFDNSFWPF